VLLALPAQAADKDKDPGFNVLDADRDGQLTRAEASANPYLLQHFSAADSNSNGRLSRMEYLKVMTRYDLDRLRNAASGNERNASSGNDRNASSGSSKAK
jgi:hypothetical protein